MTRDEPFEVSVNTLLLAIVKGGDGENLTLHDWGDSVTLTLTGEPDPDLVEELADQNPY